MKNVFNAHFMDGYMMVKLGYVYLMMENQRKCRMSNITKIFAKKVKS
jgi:hypothetical protein